MYLPWKVKRMYGIRIGNKYLDIPSLGYVEISTKKGIFRIHSSLVTPTKLGYRKEFSLYDERNEQVCASVFFQPNETDFSMETIRREIQQEFQALIHEYEKVRCMCCGKLKKK